MSNIIRIRNLDNEPNVNGELIFPVDYSGNTTNQGYTSNAKQINLDQVKDYILSNYTGTTSGTSGVNGSSGLNGTDGTSGISPCYGYQSNSIKISYDTPPTSTSLSIETIPKIESYPLSITTSVDSGICYIVSGTTVTFSVTGLTGFTDYSYEWYLNNNLVNLGNSYILSSPNDNDKIYLNQVTCNNVNNIMVVGYCSDCNSGTTGTFRYRTDTHNSYLEMCMQSGETNYSWVPIISNTWTTTIPITTTSTSTTTIIPTTTTTTTTIISSLLVLESINSYSGNLMFTFNPGSLPINTLGNQYSTDNGMTFSTLINQGSGISPRNFGSETNYPRLSLLFKIHDYTNNRDSNTLYYNNILTTTTSTTTIISPITISVNNESLDIVITSITINDSSIIPVSGDFPLSHGSSIIGTIPDSAIGINIPIMISYTSAISNQHISVDLADIPCYNSGLGEPYNCHRNIISGDSITITAADGNCV